MFAVDYAKDRERERERERERVCCNVSEKEYSSLLEVPPHTKYFYGVKLMLI